MLSEVEDGEGTAAAQPPRGELVEDGMTVGLGTGSTVAYLLARTGRPGAFPCAACPPRPGPRTRRTELGLHVEPFTLDRASTSRSTGPTRSRPTDGW